METKRVDITDRRSTDIFAFSKREGQREVPRIISLLHNLPALYYFNDFGYIAHRERSSREDTSLFAGAARITKPRNKNSPLDLGELVSGEQRGQKKLEVC